MTKDRLVSTALEPIDGAPPACEAITGEPTLPGAFRWGKQQIEIAEVMSRWKETGPCRSSGGAEKYLRKHWFQVRTTDGAEMKIYFERQARSKQESKKRWWLYTIREPEGDCK